MRDTRHIAPGRMKLGTRNLPGASWHGLLRGCILAFFALAYGGALFAESAFQPPHAYPADRYEEGWKMNPFTLKTAPVALAKKSFAEDLAIGGFWGSKDDPTIVVVNVKTGERTQLKRGVPADSGMTLKEPHIANTRKDTTAEVTLAEETAVLHFDNSYIRQVAAQSGDRQAPNPSQLPGSAGEAPPGGVPPAPGGAMPRTGEQSPLIRPPRNPAEAAAAANAALSGTRPKLNPPVPTPRTVPSPSFRRINTAPSRPIPAASPSP